MVYNRKLLALSPVQSLQTSTAVAAHPTLLKQQLLPLLLALLLLRKSPGEQQQAPPLRECAGQIREVQQSALSRWPYCHPAEGVLHLGLLVSGVHISITQRLRT
jgi:hypothetical protein